MNKLVKIMKCVVIANEETVHQRPKDVNINSFKNINT